MLLIAIPKSGSTSLMATIGSLHKIRAVQDATFINHPKPENSAFIHKNHSDIRELTPETVKKFKSGKVFYKQHIFPSDNNLNLLNEVKKVVLLRDPVEVLLAYRRGAHKKIHNLLDGFSINATEEEWIEYARQVGLLDDLKYFGEKWKNASNPQNTLFIEYHELISEPAATVNKIERFYGLPVHDHVVLKKKRYSRRNGLSNGFHNLIKKTKLKILDLAGIFGFRAYLEKLAEKRKKM